ncbi:MAG: hypothetical protein ACK4N5_09235, partial [Myxococcales bacterium]
MRRIGPILVLALLATSTAALAVIIPANITPSLTFKTNGRELEPRIGDWYTSKFTSSSARVHRMVVLVPRAAKFPVTVGINDGEVAGGNGDLADSVSKPADPTRFRLYRPNGTLLAERTFPSGTANGATWSTTITATDGPGAYVLTSETGAFSISNDPTPGLNDDQNSFQVTLTPDGLNTPAADDDLSIATYQTTFNYQSANPPPITLHVLIPPGTTQAHFRNFNVRSNSAQISYASPSGAAPIPGTVSGTAVWNGAGTGCCTLDAGFDLVPIDQPGLWKITLTNIAANNQWLVAVSDTSGNPFPLYVDPQPPVQTGAAVTLAAAGQLTGAPGASIDHPLTVTNAGATNDVAQLATSGTGARF